MSKKVNDLVVAMFNSENTNERHFDVENFAVALSTVYGKRATIEALESWLETKEEFFALHRFDGTALVIGQLKAAIEEVEKYC